MIKLPIKTGLILFTHNRANIRKPLSLVSTIIHFFQTKKIFNPKHLPTHTAQTIVIDDRLFVIDSDYDGIEPEIFEKWVENREWLQVFDPNALTEVSEKIYINKALDKSGSRYGFEDIGSWLYYKITGKFKGETNDALADDNMICVVFSQYLYSLPEWWKGSPLSLYEDRFDLFKQGNDVHSGPITDYLKVN